jgi:hypothetical protein
MKESIFLKNHIEKLHQTINSLQKENDLLKKENELLKQNKNSSSIWKKLSEFFYGSTTFEIHLNSKQKEKIEEIPEEKQKQYR